MTHDLVVSIKICYTLMLSYVSSSKLSSYDSLKSNIGWFVNDFSKTIFKYDKRVILTFKSVSHGVKITLVMAIVEALIMIKGVRES